MSINIIIYVKIKRFLVLAQVERMMRVALGGAFSGAEPMCGVFLAEAHHVAQAFHKIGALFDYGPPRRPDRRGHPCGA